MSDAIVTNLLSAYECGTSSIRRNRLNEYLSSENRLEQDVERAKRVLENIKEDEIAFEISSDALLEFANEIQKPVKVVVNVSDVLTYAGDSEVMNAMQTQVNSYDFIYQESLGMIQKLQIQSFKSTQNVEAEFTELVLDAEYIIKKALNKDTVCVKSLFYIINEASFEHFNIRNRVEVSKDRIDLALIDKSKEIDAKYDDYGDSVMEDVVDVDQSEKPEKTVEFMSTLSCKSKDAFTILQQLLKKKSNMHLASIRVVTVLKYTPSECPVIIKSHANRILFMKQSDDQLAERGLDSADFDGIAMLLEPNAKVREQLPEFYEKWLVETLPRLRYHYIGYANTCTRFAHGRLCRYAVVLAHLNVENRENAVNFKKSIAALLSNLIQKIVIDKEKPSYCKKGCVQLKHVGKNLIIYRGFVVIGKEIFCCKWKTLPEDGKYMITNVHVDDYSDKSHANDPIDVLLDDKSLVLLNPEKCIMPQMIGESAFTLLDEMHQYFVTIRNGELYVNTKLRGYTSDADTDQVFRVESVEVDEYGRGVIGGNVSIFSKSGKKRRVLTNISRLE